MPEEQKEDSEMGLEQRIAALEDEIKVLKNEIKAVLLDIREHYLNLSNPFTSFNTIRVPAIEESNELTNAQDQHLAEKTESPAKDARLSAQPRSTEIKEETSPKQEHHFMTSEPSTTDLELLNSISNQHTQTRPINQPSKTTHNGNFDLVVIAGLAQWVEQATASLGKERAEALVEIAYTMRHFPTEVRDALVRLIKLSPHEAPTGRVVSAKDYLSMLAQLDNLLASGHHETALLSILAMTKEAPDG